MKVRNIRKLTNPGEPIHISSPMTVRPMVLVKPYGSPRMAETLLPNEISKGAEQLCQTVRQRIQFDTQKYFK